MTTVVTSLPVTRSATSLLRRAWRFSPPLYLGARWLWQRQRRQN